MSKYLSFDFCPHCGKTLFNPSGEKFCYKCGKPFQKYYHEELTGNELITIRKEDTHIFLIGTYKTKSEAQEYALIDHAMLHQSNPLCKELSCMLPPNATKEDMLYWFYGIKINASLAECMQITNHIEGNGMSWIVGIASDVLLLALGLKPKR